jgi:C-terminal processing protease CtpA/Prc
MLMASQSSPETSKNANPAFVGLEITTERPYKVLSVDDLLDEALIGQGQPGYSNPDVYPGDVLVQVDRRSVEDVGLGQVLKALQGPLGTVAVLTFLRPTSDAQLVVRALRHKQHPAGSNWLQWKQPASETHEPSLRTSLGFDSLFKWSDEMRLQDVSRQSMENRRSRQEVWGDRRESRDIRKVVDDSWTQESGVRNSVATRESSTLNSTYEVFTQHQEKATLDQRREKQNVDDMIALHTIPKPTLDQQVQKQNIDMIALHTGSYSRHGPVARSGNEAGTIKFTGIGCVLTHMSDGAIFIQEIRHGGGCYEAGVPVGSQLLSVDGVPVTDMPIEKIRNLCLGPTGSVSVLTIIPPSSGREGFANSKQDVTWQEIKVYRGAKVVEANGPRMPVTVSSPQYDSRQKSSRSFSCRACVSILLKCLLDLGIVRVPVSA